MSDYPTKHALLVEQLASPSRNCDDVRSALESMKRAGTLAEHKLVLTEARHLAARRGAKTKTAMIDRYLRAIEKGAKS